MNRSILRLALTLAALTLLLDGIGVAQAQSFNEARKFDEFSTRKLNTDDISGHLYDFAQELLKNPRLTGYVVGYNEPQQTRGEYLRHIYGVGRYVEDHGLAPQRVIVIDGGYRDKRATELWLVPEGATLPKPASQISAPARDSRKAYLFDDACIDCEPAVAIDFYVLDEGLEFYAKALREEPRSRAYLVSYPNPRRPRREAIKTVNQMKGSLMNKYGISANRIVIRIGSPREDNAEVECWIVPQGGALPKPKKRGL